MYDNSRNISGELPCHINFIKNVAKPLFESWGYEVIILRNNEKDYLSLFNHIIENPKKHISHKGKKYGFPMSGNCTVKRDCKEKPINAYIKSLKDTEITQYIGICADEPKRLQAMHKNKNFKSILEELDYTEDMCKDLCIQYGLYSPAYQYSKRQGCFFCPNAKVAEHCSVKKDNPSLWEEFINLENEPDLAFPKWNIYGHTLKLRDEVVDFENSQLTLFEIAV